MDLQVALGAQLVIMNLREIRHHDFVCFFPKLCFSCMDAGIKEV